MSDMTACLNDLSYIPSNNEQNEPTQGDIVQISNELTQAIRNEFEELYASAIEELYPGCNYVTRLDFMANFTYFKVKEHGKMQHPVDGRAWKNFDTKYPDFAKEPRNVQLGLATDGFNPFGNLKSSFMLTLLIPGPKSSGKDIDVYFRPLIDNLKDLWAKPGAETIDVATGQKFNMRAMVLWTINDFPARSSLSGWSGQGYKACPTCNEDTPSTRVLGKTAYVGHIRFLKKPHKWRRSLDFNGEIEDGDPPRKFDRDDIMAQLARLPTRVKGKHPMYGGVKIKCNVLVELNWTKRSIFYELEYWSFLTLKHNLVCRHIEKNVLESILNTLLMNDKSKDTTKARQDLKRLGIRSGLWLGQNKNGKSRKPSAQSKVVDILCNLELIYHPGFFDIMIHLVIHLPLEALEGGHIHPRWMYPFERFMKKLKNYVRNKAKQEGSIAEGYIAEEALTFSSHYFRDVTTKFNRPDRNWIALLQRASFRCSDHPEIDTYWVKFKSQFPNKDMKEEFPGWFGSQIRQRHVDKDPGVSASSELFALACGPTPTPISINSCVVNVVRFVVHSRDERRTTQNNGIFSPDGQSIDVDAPPDIIDVDEDDDIIDDEDVLPHDLADSYDEDLVNVDDDDGVAMSADVARGHSGDGGGDDRPPPHQIAGGCRDSGKGTRKPNLGGRKADMMHTRKETRNLKLRKITDELGPKPIWFDWKDNGTMMPLDDHSSHWANLLGEIVREFPIHFCSWRNISAERKVGVLEKIRTQFDLKPHMQSELWPEIKKGIDQHLAKIYTDNKSSLKKDYWVKNPDDETYDMQSSATQEYPSLIQTFFDTHTVGGVFLRDEDRRLYEEMQRLQALGEYIDDQIMVMVRKGKHYGHIPSVGRGLAGRGKDVINVPEPRCKHTSDVDEIKRTNKQLKNSESGAGGDDESGDDEDAGEDEEDEDFHHDIAVVVAAVAVFAAPHQVAAAVTVELDQVKEYQDVVKVASHSMVYASLHELEVFLSDGVYLNG
ncbi:hypothetical protein Tco_0992133 [Tanacetum coccineum]|uniref:DUF4218 domain-containing protein n=1 Tax=Tanacetum coccineum TaxID=301880 RepID=A0ABQ5F2B3_9ASTR